LTAEDWGFDRFCPEFAVRGRLLLWPFGFGLGFGFGFGLGLVLGLAFAFIIDYFLTHWLTLDETLR
jgi:hypothetical protein